MEQTFTQKVEQVVQRKVDEIMAVVDNRLRYQHNNNQHQTISGSSSSPLDSHGGGARLDNDLTSQVMNIQSHQPSLPSSYNNVLPAYHRYQPYNHHRYRQPAFNNYPQNINSNNNWGFYEHPITQKRVRDSPPHLFGFEPPTRDLPLISLVATTRTESAAVTAPQQQRQISNAIADDDDDGFNIPASSAKGERNANQYETVVPKTYNAEAQKRFQRYDLALESLRENVRGRAYNFLCIHIFKSNTTFVIAFVKFKVTSLEKELVRVIRHQKTDNDYSEVRYLK